MQFPRRVRRTGRRHLRHLAGVQQCRSHQKVVFAGLQQPSRLFGRLGHGQPDGKSLDRLLRRNLHATGQQRRQIHRVELVQQQFAALEHALREHPAGQYLPRAGSPDRGRGRSRRRPSDRGGDQALQGQRPLHACGLPLLPDGAVRPDSHRRSFDDAGRRSRPPAQLARRGDRIHRPGAEGVHGGDGAGALPRQREPARRAHQGRRAGAARQTVGLCRQPALQRRMARGSGADEQGRKTALPRPERLETANGGGPSARLPRLRRAGQPLRTAQHGQPGRRPLQTVPGIQQGDHLGHLDQCVGQAGRTEIRHLRNPALAASGSGRIPRPARAGR